jgi:hypothetical protein
VRAIFVIAWRLQQRWNSIALLEPLSVNFKLIFHPTTGKIWGAQAVGEDGAEKRIDVISTAMQGCLTIADLAELELCYAPPVGSAKDPVNIAGMAAQNVIDGFVEQVDWSQLKTVTAQPDVVVSESLESLYVVTSVYAQRCFDDVPPRCLMSGMLAR